MVFKQTPFDVIARILECAERNCIGDKCSQLVIFKLAVEMRLVRLRNKILLQWYTWSRASEYGFVEILDILMAAHKRSPKLVKVPSGIDIHSSLLYASRNGHVHILEWWKNSGLRLSWAIHQMDVASQHNQVNVLQWWKNSGLQLRYRLGKHLALHAGANDAFLWWKNSGLPNKPVHCSCQFCSG